jgi:hypothetical protein
MIKPAFPLIAFLWAAPVQAAAPSEGGSTEVGAQSGCVNEWVFDGVWRVRVTSVAFHPAGDAVNGWDVSMQWANGTTYSGIAPTDTLKQPLVLALAKMAIR